MAEEKNKKEVAVEAPKRKRKARTASTKPATKPKKVVVQKPKPILEAKFLSVLDASCIYPLANGGRGVWRIDKPLIFESKILNKRIEIEVGFLTDYASTPRLPFVYWLFGDTGKYESVVHDWLYHHHEVCDEATANLVLLEAAIAIGTPRWTRMGLYLGVEFGGKTSWEEDGRGDGHTFVDGRII